MKNLFGYFLGTLVCAQISFANATVCLQNKDCEQNACCAPVNYEPCCNFKSCQPRAQFISVTPVGCALIAAGVGALTGWAASTGGRKGDPGCQGPRGLRGPQGVPGGLGPIGPGTTINVTPNVLVGQAQGQLEAQAQGQLEAQGQLAAQGQAQGQAQIQAQFQIQFILFLDLCVDCEENGDVIITVTPVVTDPEGVRIAGDAIPFSRAGFLTQNMTIEKAKVGDYLVGFHLDASDTQSIHGIDSTINVINQDGITALDDIGAAQKALFGGSLDVELTTIYTHK